MSDILAFCVALLVLLVVATATGAAMALPVMWLWNYVVVDGQILGTGARPLDFWHAWALLVLCGLLIKSSNTTTKK